MTPLRIEMSGPMIARLEAIAAGIGIRMHDGTTAALQRRGLIRWWRPLYPASGGYSRWHVTEAGKEVLAARGDA